MNHVYINTQEEMNDVSADFNGMIYVLGDHIKVLKNYPFASVEACENSFVIALNNSSVMARRNSSVDACGYSSVSAWGHSSVSAWGYSSVEAHQNSSVVAWENSSIVAQANSSVEARGHSHVEARDSSSVTALENSSVLAWENSSVRAWGNSLVVLHGFSQASVFSDDVKVQLFDLGRLIKPNDSMQNFVLYHGIDVVNGNAVLYKAVRKNLTSFYDKDFQYVIGEKRQHECDLCVLRECSYGLHVSTLAWAKDFGKHRPDDFVVLKCLVPIECIVVPKGSDGKVRTSELVVVGMV
jgi:hypothetical protein